RPTPLDHAIHPRPAPELGGARAGTGDARDAFASRAPGACADRIRIAKSRHRRLAPHLRVHRQATRPEHSAEARSAVPESGCGDASTGDGGETATGETGKGPHWRSSSRRGSVSTNLGV